MLTEAKMEVIIAETLSEFLNLGGESAKEAAKRLADDPDSSVKAKKGKDVKGTVHSL